MRANIGLHRPAPKATLIFLTSPTANYPSIRLSSDPNTSTPHSREPPSSPHTPHHSNQRKDHQVVTTSLPSLSAFSTHCTASPFGHTSKYATLNVVLKRILKTLSSTSTTIANPFSFNSYPPTTWVKDVHIFPNASGLQKPRLLNPLI